MKKLAVLLVVLGLLAASLPAEKKDVVVSDNFWVFAKYDLAADPATAASSFVKARIGFDLMADDYNEIYFQFRGDGSVGVSTDDDPVTLTDNEEKDQIRFRQAWLKTDVGAALKLPIGVKTTFGYFDTYFTNWSYVSMSGWEFYYDWPNKLAEEGQNSDGAFQLDVAVGPVNIHWWNDFLFKKAMVGADAAFGPATAYLAYDWTMVEGFGSGNLSVEAKYSGKFGDLALAVPAFFRYGLGDEAYTYGGGVAADYKIFHVGAGLEGDNVSALDNSVVDISVAPMEGLKLAVSLYFDIGNAAYDDFGGLVVELRKKIGVTDAVLGYVYTNEGQDLPTYDDNFSVANGLFVGMAASY